MSVKVNVSSDGLDRKFSHSSLVRGRKAAANDAHQAMEKYVPMLHTDASTTGLQLFYNEFEAYAPDGP